MQDFVAANIDEWCRNHFATCHEASIMQAPNLRPIVTISIFRFRDIILDS